MEIKRYMVFRIETHEFWVPNNIYNTREAYSDHEYITFDSEQVCIETEKFVGILSMKIVAHMYEDTDLPLPELECVRGSKLLEQLNSGKHCSDHTGSSIIDEKCYYRLVEFNLGF